ncbi:cell surface protein [Microvenator marinus]|uniref:Cell surface protein n=1 Tax=Microvenator marinus TaxID=2600177 RepID=A0A5B8XPK0_9DELT|nr:cell surface protein [Microvenator marinus]QED26868.1 cell surface protein [Microvenator marinus]
MRAVVFSLIAACLGGCGEDIEPAKDFGPFAREVVSFEPGEFAGYGDHEFPDIVLGPPEGGGISRGGMRVLSLGVGGEIVMDLGEFANGPGADFIVFENPFFAGGDPTEPFEEFGRVSVSQDLEEWHTWDCVPAESKEGCAGWNPVLEFEYVPGEPLDPTVTGGDAFDLGELNLGWARYVKIEDLKTLPGEGNTAGFDLDALGWIHSREGTVR